MHTKDVPALLIAAMLWTAVAPARAASTGITNLGGAAVVAVNHLGLGWNTPAVNQITAWLSAP
jgi:hypothetical protein